MPRWPKTGAETFAPPAPTHTVGKPIRVNGELIPHGEPIDASEWEPRRVRLLEEQRYLIPIASARAGRVAPAQAGEGTDHGESTHQG